MAVAEAETTKKTTRRKKSEEPTVPPNIQMTVEEFEAAVDKAAEKVIKRTIRAKVDKVFREEWDKVTVANINEMARELIGRDFWEVINISKQMTRGDGVWSLTDISLTMQRLGGYYTTISTTSAILEGQYHDAFAENFVEAKKQGHTDGTCTQIATFAVSEINTRRLLFRNLRESVLEQVNILKKLFEATRDERRNITPIQA